MVEIFGNTLRIFELSRSFFIDKNSRLRAQIHSLDVAEFTGICLYEGPSVVYNTRPCLEIAGISGVLDVEIGGLLNYRKAEVRYIGFVQEHANVLNYGTSVQSINIVPGLNEDIVQDGQCTDPNALPLLTRSNTFSDNILAKSNKISRINVTCICAEGYVSSNGGRAQGDLDVCVSCVSSPFCGFEGDPCSTGSECDEGSCDEGACKPKVSISS